MILYKNIKYKIGVLPPASWKVESNVIKKTVEDWIADPRTKKGHLDCKHRSVAAGLKEFRTMYYVREYFITYHDQNQFCKDDSLEIWYRT